MSDNLSSFRMTQANPEQHLRAISEITSNEFAGGQYIEEIAQQYINNSHYDWETTRLIWEGDKLVHHWGVWGYLMRLDNVLLKVAGIGAVTTRQEYRKQGLMGMVVQDSLKAMSDHGYDLSILRGRHYVKYGYVRAWNYVTYILKPEEIPALEFKGTYELLEPDKMEQINEVYNQNHQGFTGTCVRPTYSMLKADDMMVYGWFDGDGLLLGYVRAVPSEDKKYLQCLEAAGDPEMGLAVLRDLFNKGDYETLKFFTLPHQHPILQYLRRGACIVEDRYFHNTGWRVRIINLHSALEKLRPLLEKRLHLTSYANWTGSLLLDSGEHQAEIKVENRIVKISKSNQANNAIIGGQSISRLLIGSDDPGEVICQEGIKCTGEAAELAQALFPNLYPVMSHWDEY